MLTPVLGAVAGLATLSFIVALVVAIRRGQRGIEIETQLAALRRAADEAGAKLDDKSRQADELRSKLDRQRDENAKLKKKLHQRAQPEPEPQPDAEIGRVEQELGEARARAKRAEQAAAEAAAEAERLRDQRDKARADKEQAERAARQQDEARDERQQGRREELAGLRKKVRRLEDKLAAANRRSRTDAQVYRVTNSKLELAMEKITELERRLGAAAEPGDSA
jgi:peptidoglycan hydrolase CwlO-like protein